jgi:hypothetical protein
MTLKMVAVMAALGAAAVTLSADETLARGRGGGIAAPFVRPGVPIGPKPVALHHHRRGFAGTFWPGSGFYYGDAPYGGAMVDAAAPLSNDVNYTYTYKQDVPWDWAHRYPPAVAPSDRPYVSSCSNEPVTVPGRGGEQTVNVMRCY